MQRSLEFIINWCRDIARLISALETAATIMHTVPTPQYLPSAIVKLLTIMIVFGGSIPLQELSFLLPLSQLYAWQGVADVGVGCKTPSLSIREWTQVMQLVSQSITTIKPKCKANRMRATTIMRIIPIRDIITKPKTRGATIKEWQKMAIKTF